MKKKSTKKQAVKKQVAKKRATKIQAAKKQAAEKRRQVKKGIQVVDIPNQKKRIYLRIQKQKPFKSLMIFMVYTQKQYVDGK